MLFDLAHERRRDSGLDLGESLYSWLDQSSRLVSRNAREAFNRWFCEYPLEHRDELAAAIKSADLEVAEGSLFELYVHHLLRSAGSDVSRFAGLHAGSTPDYQVRVSQNAVLLVEATLLRDSPDIERSLVTTHDLVRRASAFVRRSDYLVHLDDCASGAGSAAARKLATHFDRSAQEALGEPRSTRTLMEVRDGPFEYVDRSGWRLTYEIWSSPPRRSSQSVLAGSGGEAMRVDTPDRIRGKINEKLRQHRAHEAPLVIALGCPGVIHALDDECLADALIGSCRWHYRTDDRGQMIDDGQSRDSNGVWHKKGGLSAAHPHALICVDSANPLRLPTARACLWENPWMRDVDSLRPWPFARRGWNLETHEHYSICATVEASTS